MSAEGKFEGDLCAFLDRNSGEPRKPYRVRVYVWRTNSAGDTGWFKSYDGLTEYEEYGGFKAERRFKHSQRALRYFGEVKGERARRRAGRKITEARDDGWTNLA